MPDPVSTATAGFEPQQSITTGAMMEFLGGDIGQSLPFSSDAATSSIPLPTDCDWMMSEDPVQEAAINYDIDRLIAETTEAQSGQNLTADVFPISTAEVDVPTDLAMEDFNFDDIVFDMPMDDTVEQSSGL